MRTIERTTRFRRDYKRVRAGQRGPMAEILLREIIAQLANDGALAPRFRDHALTGDWDNHRDCHVFPDLVLIYKMPDDATLQLVRIGSHSDLGL